MNDRIGTGRQFFKMLRFRETFLRREMTGLFEILRKVHVLVANEMLKVCEISNKMSRYSRDNLARGWQSSLKLLLRLEII